MEIVVSGKEMMADQAEGTGAEPVPDDAQIKKEGRVDGTGKPVPDVGRSGGAPDLMEVDPAVRTGGGSVCVEGGCAAIAPALFLVHNQDHYSPCSREESGRLDGSVSD